MSEEIILTSRARAPQTSKGLLRLSRFEGSIPAILYGASKTSKSLWVSRLELEKAMRQAHSANVLFQLQIEAKETPGQTKAKFETEHVLLKEVQRNPINEVPCHVDFFRVDLKKRVEVNVPLRVTGEATGVKNQGGILELLAREVKIRCLPTAIPEAFTIDVTPLGIGQGVFIKDLTVPQGVEVLTDGNHLVVTVAAPVKEEEPAAAVATTGAAGAEPEVITKGKKEAEGEAASAAAPKSAAAAAPKAETPSKK
ncbi:MAG: 50S ribosomal protein L25 [Elusimicrobia bacterium]|nr:50S ribosomal protein L25 [Elusimicrobiota bacterium]